MTERRIRRIKPSVTYRMPPDIESKIDDRIAAGEFANRSDAITRGLRFWLDFERLNIKSGVREFLETEEGIELVKTAARKHQKK